MTKTLPKALTETNVPGCNVTRGKVRDIYDIGNGKMVIVTTDRISAFDVVMKTGIPLKGVVLTQLSLFWSDMLSALCRNHVLGRNHASMPPEFSTSVFSGRSVLVRKLNPLPVECIVRGHITGSGWKSYKNGGTVCGIRLPDGLEQCQKLQNPIFTPTTKAGLGKHDENITFERMGQIVGMGTARMVKALSLLLYNNAYEYALGKDITIADTKFEFAVADGSLVLIDEVLTPDSSRFWPADKFQTGRDQESFDKQFVRSYLEETGFDKSGPGVELPDDVVAKISEKYVEAFERITGRQFSY